MVLHEKNVDHSYDTTLLPKSEESCCFRLWKAVWS